MSCSTLTRGYSAGFASIIALCTVYSSVSCRGKIHTALSNHETHYCIKARRRCCDAHGRRQTLLLCHSTTHQTVRALPSIEHHIHPRTQYPSPEKMLWGFRGRGKSGCCCVQARDRYCDYANNRCSTVHGRFCFAGARGGATPPGIYLTSLCPGRREVRPRQNKINTPLANTSEHDTPLLCQARDNPAVSKHDKGCCVKARDRLPSQSTRHMLGQTNRHSAVIKARDTCCVKAKYTVVSNHETHYYCIKARRRCCDAHGRRQTLHTKP